MTFRIGYKSNNNIEILFFILAFKRDNGKIRKKKNKKDKKEYHGYKKEVVRRERGILKVSVNYSEIYE